MIEALWQAMCPAYHGSRRGDSGCAGTGEPGRADAERLPSPARALSARDGEVRGQVFEHEVGDPGAELLAGYVVEPGVLPGEDAA